MQEAGPAVWLAFAAYLAATFWLAYRAHAQAKGGSFLDEFFVAGRGIGPAVLGLTWIATAASGGSFIGTPSLAYSYGWSVMLWICGYMVVATVGIGLIGSRIHEIGVKDWGADVPRDSQRPVWQPRGGSDRGRGDRDSLYRLHGRPVRCGREGD